jgi:hypothetical protein
MLFGEECNLLLSRHLAILFTQILVMINHVITFANEKNFRLVDLHQRLEGIRRFDVV